MSLKIKAKSSATVNSVKPLVQEQDDASQQKNKPSKKDRNKPADSNGSMAVGADSNASFEYGPVNFGKVEKDEIDDQRLTRYLEATMHQKKIRMEQEKVDQEKRKTEMMQAFMAEEKRKAEEEVLQKRAAAAAVDAAKVEQTTTTAVTMKEDPLKLNISHSVEMKRPPSPPLHHQIPVSPKSNRKPLPQPSPLRGSSPPPSPRPSSQASNDMRERIGSEHLMGKIDNDTLEASLMFLKSLPNVNKLAGSTLISDLMKSYLPVDNKHKPTAIVKPTVNDVTVTSDLDAAARKTGSIGEQLTSYEKVDEIDKDVARKTQKKQPPPPPRPKTRTQRSWVDPRDHQRMQGKQKQWPPVASPDDRDCYVVEGYGQTDPYSLKLIKDIQKEKRVEQEKIEAEKRSEVVEENLQPVQKLRDAFSHKSTKEKPGVIKPEAAVQQDTEWIKHNIPVMDYQPPPDEPNWMNLIRTRRWKSTVRARFPCDMQKDKYEFERRSTTPKHWKRLVKDKNAMKMLSEIVGIGPEGEELFQKLASQKSKIDGEEKDLDRQTEEELMAYEIARDNLGVETLVSMQRDTPLPGGRQKANDPGASDVALPSNVGAAYPFTTSQLEAAFLTDKLLKLHPEEFRKLMSMERSRNASLRWQFSADPFDSVHEHQEVPYEIALLASEEPRVRQAMRKYLQNTGSSYGGSTGRCTPRRTQSEGGYASDLDGYESAGANSEVGGERGRKKKVGPPPKPKPKSRSSSATGMMRLEKPTLTIDASGNLALPNRENYHSGSGSGGSSAKTLRDDADGDREVHAHGLLSDQELQLSQELADMEEMTRKIRSEVEDDLMKITESLGSRQDAFLQEAKKTEEFTKQNEFPVEIDKQAMAERRDAYKANLPASETAQDEAPEVRHQVRKIADDAQLKEVFGKRREVADASVVDGESKPDDTPK